MILTKLYSGHYDYKSKFCNLGFNELYKIDIHFNCKK